MPDYDHETYTALPENNEVHYTIKLLEKYFYGVKSYNSGAQYKRELDITNGIKGHTYYAKVTFYADGSIHIVK